MISEWIGYEFVPDTFLTARKSQVFIIAKKKKKVEQAFKEKFINNRDLFTWERSQQRGRLGCLIEGSWAELCDNNLERMAGMGLSEMNKAGGWVVGLRLVLVMGWERAGQVLPASPSSNPGRSCAVPLSLCPCLPPHPIPTTIPLPQSTDLCNAAHCRI